MLLASFQLAMCLGMFSRPEYPNINESVALILT